MKESEEERNGAERKERAGKKDRNRKKEEREKEIRTPEERPIYLVSVYIRCRHSVYTPEKLLS